MSSLSQALDFFCFGVKYIYMFIWLLVKTCNISKYLEQIWKKKTYILILQMH